MTPPDHQSERPFGPGIALTPILVVVVWLVLAVIAMGVNRG